jgi:hypothetical protein
MTHGLEAKRLVLRGFEFDNRAECSTIEPQFQALVLETLSAGREATARAESQLYQS